MIIVDLLLAVICFNTPQECYPVLIGKDTPRGIYSTTLRLTEQAGYDNDVIQFHETNTHVYAIHRLWNLNPKQNREARIVGPIANRTITGGCVNVSPLVYERIKNCCLYQPLLIK